MIVVMGVRSGCHFCLLQNRALPAGLRDLKLFL
jgi:hypothetical protein